MKAVILAGGEGTRLKAVTGDTPNPLVPLLGRSMMEHILRLLRRCGFTEVCAALRYHAADFEKAFSDGSQLGLRLCYRVEDEPLGTAGAVKNCEDFYGDEDFLLISGDAACDFDLAALAEEHRARGAAVTVALTRESVPLRFGLAVTDAAGDIRGFVEKPDWGRVVSDLVNTGIYVLSPRAMARVPRGVPFDFARDLFPLLLREGEKLAGVVCEGYWCDVGTPASYYRCCADALEGRLRLELPEAFSPPRGRGAYLSACRAERRRRRRGRAGRGVRSLACFGRRGDHQSAGSVIYKRPSLRYNGRKEGFLFALYKTRRETAWMWKKPYAI